MSHCGGGAGQWDRKSGVMEGFESQTRDLQPEILEDNLWGNGWLDEQLRIDLWLSM